MKSKLQNADELCLRYALKELDPSEEMMVEQAMMNDEDILIEVETLRSTLKKIDNLPVFDAPPSVIDGVLARLDMKEPHKARVYPIRSFKKLSYAAAATFLIASGTMWYVQTSGNNVTLVTEDVAETGYTATPAENSPWIDRRDIMHVSSIGAGASVVADSANQKLTPIDTDTPSSRQHRQVQLTGTQK